MVSMWFNVVVISLIPFFILSSPEKLQEYGPGAFLGVVMGLLSEYALADARPIWDGATLLLPLGHLELTYIIFFYGSQSCLLLQFLRATKHFQVVFVLGVAVGTALFEVLLSPILFGGMVSISQFLSMTLFHALRLYALVAVFSGLGYFERVMSLHQEREAIRKVHRSVRMWHYIWPTTAVAAFAMLRVTQRIARRP